MNLKSNLAYVLSGSVLIAGIAYYYFVPKQEKVETQSVTFIDTGFDTIVNFSTTCTPSQFQTYSRFVQDTFKEYNAYFDLYNAYEGISNIYTLNHAPSETWTEVEEPIIDCIQIAQSIHAQNAKFDITQGRLLNVWHTYRNQGMELNNEKKDGILPSIDILEKAYNPISNGLHIQGNAISLEDGVQLDLGGIAKGYTAQKVKEKLLSMGCDNGYINAGGNVVLLGEKVDGSSWKVGIQSPDENSSLASIESKQAISYVTSGDYQRYFTVSGERYGHIIDPDTLYPASKFRSVTILYEDSALADAYSTLLYTLDLEDGKHFAQKHYLDVVWVINGQEEDADFTTNKYSIYCTDSLRERIHVN